MPEYKVKMEDQSISFQAEGEEDAFMTIINNLEKSEAGSKRESNMDVREDFSLEEQEEDYSTLELMLKNKRLTRENLFGKRGR